MTEQFFQSDWFEHIGRFTQKKTPLVRKNFPPVREIFRVVAGLFGILVVMKKSNKNSVWTSVHDQRLPIVMTDLKDGVDGVVITGKQVKARDSLFELLDSALLGRKIRQWRNHRSSNGLVTF